MLLKRPYLKMMFLFRKRDCNQDGTSTAACSLDLYPEENSWHFITVTPKVSDRVIAFAISISITGTLVILM